MRGLMIAMCVGNAFVVGLNVGASTVNGVTCFCGVCALFCGLVAYIEA